MRRKRENPIGPLREVARLRRAELDREADRARYTAEHDVELLERVEALRTRGGLRRFRGAHAGGTRRGPRPDVTAAR